MDLECKENPRNCGLEILKESELDFKLDKLSVPADFFKHHSALEWTTVHKLNKVCVVERGQK